MIWLFLLYVYDWLNIPSPYTLPREMFDASILFINWRSIEYISKSMLMFSVYVPGNVPNVDRYYPCTIAYTTYTTSPTRRGRIAPTILRGRKGLRLRFNNFHCVAWFPWLLLVLRFCCKKPACLNPRQTTATKSDS